MVVFLNIHSLSFFCHCHPESFRENKKSRQEGYTAPSCHTALWHGGAAVASAIDLYCAPLMEAAFIICKQRGTLILWLFYCDMRPTLRN